MTKVILAGGVSQDQINAWKKQHGDIYAIDVNTDDKGKNKATGYFKKPNLAIIGAASKYIETDPMQSSAIMFDSCWLGGDPEMQNVDEVKASAMGKLGELFKIREASIKKL